VPVLAAALKTADGMLARREWAQAAALYRDILRQAPDTLPALYNLGTLLAGFYPDADGALPGELAEAAQCFEKYLRIKPGDGDAAAALGFVRIGQGRDGDARRMMDAAMQAAAATPKTLSRLGHYYRQLGDMAAAEKAFHAALARAPALGGAWYGLSGLPGGIDTGGLQQLESLWRQGAFAPGDDRVFAAFALAKSHQSAGDAKAAHDYYAAGNAAKRASYKNFELSRRRTRSRAGGMFLSSA
jgi:tetratricopeptide (TPR) repeat protein